ncbi:hypothetical protein G6F65_022411 [Rhizopus arrhizus]|nr:hypothetical protein G6F65_022411 [Rhizopus arrhizus]
MPIALGWHEQTVRRVAAVGQNAEGAGQHGGDQDGPVLQRGEQAVRVGLRDAGARQHFGHHGEQENGHDGMAAGLP